jgi:hypothetical protein
MWLPMTNRIVRPALLNVTSVLLALFVSWDAFAAEDARPYDQGPLTADDFRADPPDDSIAAAKTATQFAFEFKYGYKSTARTTIVTLSRITITACIRRDQSWNRHPDNKRLLDHEQGHADIAQIHCLHARLAFRKLLAKGQAPSATASSLSAGVAGLDRAVRKEMAAFEKAAKDADAEYDRVTANGVGPQQQEWRRVQAETLKELTAAWEGKK